MREGWLKLHYSIIDWEFSDAPNMLVLWIHLLLHAETKTVKHNGITVRRGQLLTSVSQICEWTGLSAQMVRTGIKKLTATKQITSKATNKSTCITICKFESYQESQQAHQQTEQQANQQSNNKQNAAIPISSPSESKHMFRAQELKKETSPKGEEKKEGSQGSLLSLQTRAKNFYDSLVPFLESYPKAMIRSFYDYWSEPNKSKTKMRFELEKTWETSRRLSTWAHREGFNRGSNNNNEPGKVEKVLAALEESGSDINTPTRLL